MISALTVSHSKVITEDSSGARWMVVTTCHGPSTQLVNIATGEVCHFGDQGLTAKRFTETDEVLSGDERGKGFERMHRRRKGSCTVAAGSVDIEGKKLASVHKLQVVDNSDLYAGIKDISEDPAKEYLDLIAEELLNLSDLCVKGRLRGIAISYVTMDDGDNEHIYNHHNFITDGRGLASLNAGIDLVKSYVVQGMRERFGSNKQS